MTWELRQDGAPAGSGEHTWGYGTAVAEKLRLDAGETNILAQQLEELETEVAKHVYPTLKAAQIVPMDMTGDPGAETVKFIDMDGNAKWGLLGDDARGNDAQSQSMSRDSDFLTYYSFCHAFGYTISDIRRAAKAGVPLESEAAIFARQGWNELHETIVATGYAGTKLRGFLNYSGVDIDTEEDAWEDETSGSDLVALMMNVLNTRNEEVEMADELMPNRYVLPPSIYNHVNTVPFTTTTDSGKSALDVFLEKARKIVPDFQVTWWRKCRTAGAEGDHRSVLYRADPMIVKAKVSVDFEMLPLQSTRYGLEVPCHARTAGVMIRNLLGVKYIDIPVETA